MQNDLQYEQQTQEKHVSGNIGSRQGRQRMSTRKMAVAGMLGAVAIVLSVTGLGMIPVPSLAGRATIMHVPVILAAILEGPAVGAFTGFIFMTTTWGRPVKAIPTERCICAALKGSSAASKKWMTTGIV